MTQVILRMSLITLAVSVLASLPPHFVATLWAAEAAPPSGASASQKNTSHERAAVAAIGRARYSAQNRKARDLIDQIENAETALLNVEQVGRDPHIDAALRHLDAARGLAATNALRAAEAELALATTDVAVALVAADPDTSALDVPTIGEAAFDADTEPVGDVTEVVFDPEGKVGLIVVGVGNFLGTGEKNVAVPPSDANQVSGYLTINRSKRQLQEATDYRLPDYGAAVSGSTTPPPKGETAPGSDRSSR